MRLTLNFTNVHRQMFTAFAGFFYSWMWVPAGSLGIPIFFYFILETIQPNVEPFSGLPTYINAVINLTVFLSGFGLFLSGLINSTPKLLVYLFLSILWASLLLPYFWDEDFNIFCLLTMLPFLILSLFSLYTNYKLKA